MTIYTADKFDRMSHPQNPERDYSVVVDGKRYRVSACSLRGAEIQARKYHEAKLDAEQGGRRR